MRATYTPAQRLAAEAIGTAFLIATIVGSGIMAERLAEGNFALALLCTTFPAGAILTVLITGLGPISGGHLNPAISLVFALRRELAWREAGGYVLAQLAGAVLGVVVAHLMFAVEPLQAAANMRAGRPLIFAEVVATFGLIFTILTVLNARAAAVAPAVGLYVTAATWFTASSSFANPAVTLGRTLTDSFTGIRAIDAPAFIAAQLLGAVLAWLLCRALAPGGRTRRREPAKLSEAEPG